MNRPWMDAWRLALPAVAALAIVAGPLAMARDDDEDSDNKAEKARGRVSVVATAATLDNVNVLTRLLIVSGLNDALRSEGPFTVFAPTDEAFARLGKEAVASLFEPENKGKLVEILKYHVVPGRLRAKDLGSDSQPRTLLGKPLTVAANDRGLAINDATVVKADIPARNGVIHVIDRVLSPGQDGVLDVARKGGQFETLLAAIQAAGLADALGGDGPFTVLAPTDKAFEKLGAHKIKALLKPENKAALAEILKYHVIPARVTARQAVAQGEAKTLQGARVEVKIADGRIEIGGARVVATDLSAANGIVHVIDAVLIPPGK